MLAATFRPSLSSARQLTEVEDVALPIASGPVELIGKSMDEIEKWAIAETLKVTNGNREEAARILEIGARTLYRKLDKYGLP